MNRPITNRTELLAYLMDDWGLSKDDSLLFICEQNGIYPQREPTLEDFSAGDIARMIALLPQLDPAVDIPAWRAKWAAIAADDAKWQARAARYVTPAHHISRAGVRA